MSRSDARSVRGSPRIRLPGRASPRRSPDVRWRRALLHSFGSWACQKHRIKFGKGVNASLYSRAGPWKTEGEMTRTTTFVLVVICAFALPLAADSFHVTFSGNFTYSVGGGKARMQVQDVV